MMTLCQKDDVFHCGLTITGWRTVTPNDLCHVSALFLNRGMTLGYDIEIVSASMVSRDFDRTVKSVT